MIGGTVHNSVDTTTRGDASAEEVGDAGASTAPARRERPERQGRGIASFSGTPSAA